MKKVVAFMEFIYEMDFQKDIILMPSYLAKHRNVPCVFYYGQSTSGHELPSRFRNVELRCLNAKGLKFYLKLLWVIIRQNKSIDYLTTLHLSHALIIYTIVLKFLNKRAHVWNMADLDRRCADNLSEHRFVYSSGIKGIIKKILIDRFFKTIDLFSIETSAHIGLFEDMFRENGWNCLMRVPLGWDEDSENSLPASIEDKENIIFSCARFGTYQKNTEMLLTALADVDLKDWKVYLVGPITKGFDLSSNKSFEKYIEDYYEWHPNLRDKIIFTGPIFDTKQLFSYFRRAKIFVMTSRSEGFANVFAQARWNRCHIVSTDVGGACDMSDNWKYGHCVPQENPDYLSSVLNELLSNEDKITMPDAVFASEISYNNIIQKVISRISSHA